MKMYTPIDHKGNLIFPINVVNKACDKQVKCLPGAKVDKELFAKREFGKGNYAEVEFDDSLPVGSYTDNEGNHVSYYTGVVTNGVAEVNKTTVNLQTSEKLAHTKDIQRADWASLIRAAIDVEDQSNWKIIEKKVAIGQIPSDAEFKAHDANYNFD